MKLKKDEHFEMTISECKRLKNDVTDLKLAFSQISSMRSPEVRMTDFRMATKCGTVHCFTPMLVGTRCALGLLPMYGVMVRVLMLVWLST